MVVLLNLRNLIILITLYVGIALTTWTCLSHASKLTDIRIGEHETHTRIVFEHGDTIPNETLRTLTAGRLAVVFPDTELDLIRKIPTDRSKHLKKIKIWQHGNELSLVLTFAFEHFRYELSKIDQPKRLVLDVYRMTPFETTSVSTPENKDNDIPDQLPSAPTRPVVAKAITPEQTAAPKREPLQSGRTTEPPPQPAARPWRLQHYLAIGLVILTLTILVLLLVMLVLKDRWINFSSQIKSSNFFQSQNKRMAALNAQIQERLKHFNKK